MGYNNYVPENASYRCGNFHEIPKFQTNPVRVAWWMASVDGRFVGVGCLGFWDVVMASNLTMDSKWWRSRPKAVAGHVLKQLRVFRVSKMTP